MRWVRSKKAIKVLFDLGGLQVGDQLRFKRLSPTKLYQTHVMDDEDMVRRMLLYYNQPNLIRDDKMWQCIGWRRPTKETK